MSVRISRYVTTAAAAAVLSGCATARPAASSAPALGVASSSRRVVATATGQTVSFAQMADAAAKADVVFFGEQHDDEETHRAELDLLRAIGERRKSVILSLEMFERDVQPLVDAYLAGTLSEAEFRAQSRPWPNYGADYRPLVELAKANGWRVIASNIPRRLASAVSRRGLPAIDSLPPGDRAFVAADIQCPKDQYYRNFVDVMGASGHGAPASTSTTPSAAPSMTDLFYQSQCVKDETMAEAIVASRMRDGGRVIVLHFNGSFHSDFGLGTAARVVRRVPTASTIVISAVPTPSPATEPVAAVADRGQYIIFAQRIKP